ncbi:hypothetical protein [Algoriphagus winogradskyi]|uniref:Lipocalin-like domain-containing protein n=1 Tax=Algoriphagus winogradskyi TaxID=237017 RepID=A0ABY1PEA6_9BACT|nr:hypothetical protein [Algoriphagus winogradskyi]SMP31906.1 hypothetical protein SAMN06265367_107230 [Algoriphagus winogradskyi]
MRYFWIGFICLIGFSSCDKEDNLPFDLTAEGIVGKWELYQYQGNTGADDYRTPYEPSGTTITFLANGKLKSEKFFGCTDGEYQVADRNLTVLLDCEGEVPEKSYFLKMENADLVMHPKAPYMCIEGCSFIFKKINS